MITQWFNVPGSGSPVTLLGPVDADYEVIVNFNASVFLGSAAWTGGQSFGDGACLFYDTATDGSVTVKLKTGDSLLALGYTSAAEVGVFAQPC